MCVCRPIECDCNLFLEAEKINDSSLLLGVQLQAPHFLANFSPQHSSNMPHSIDVTFEMSKFEGKSLTLQKRRDFSDSNDPLTSFCLWYIILIY